MRTVFVSGSPINIGVVGENLATEVVFDIKRLIDDVGDGSVSLLNRKFGEESAYVCETTRTTSEDSDYLSWVVKGSDLPNEAGLGECELVVTGSDSSIVKDVIYTTCTERGLSVLPSEPDEQGEQENG